LVNRYITRRTKLIGERGGDLITGRLLGTDDMPLGEKILQIFASSLFGVGSDSQSRG
jgi:hypothetical protein